eukprot:CAMPEP_0177788020 /NCGR_PEP_ID=MMETSP0491_2-20121128/21855_1 /TAXON_ID=63592 /ORGANISM="Tetraselmis chuii, Strain PLY429" /LENGTH=211 /DNA_ID=CAMNT_0019309513 /DNA_START=380 /DNA_END=1016 /DNA_ORIENTATION=+
MAVIGDEFPATSRACTQNQYRVSGSKVSLTTFAEPDGAPSMKYDVMSSYSPSGISYSVLWYSLTSPIPLAILYSWRAIIRMRHDSQLVDQDDPSDWHRDLVDETLEKPTKSKPAARRAKRGKGGGQHVEEEVDSRGDGGGRKEREEDPHEEPLRAFMESDFFKQGRWKLAASMARAAESKAQGKAPGQSEATGETRKSAAPYRRRGGGWAI